MSNVIPVLDHDDDDFQPTGYSRRRSLPIRRGSKAVSFHNTPATVFSELARGNIADVEVDQEQDDRPQSSGPTAESSALDITSVVIAVLIFVAVVVIITMMRQIMIERLGSIPPATTPTRWTWHDASAETPEYAAQVSGSLSRAEGGSRLFRLLKVVTWGGRAGIWLPPGELHVLVT
ncbi:hypothetical protein CPLU01_09126 [Colletotrichum plurivorum]|uniref:Uncharacterized protein n=1 Tax=Colletotrichum plurivorum TaxID=2175906 RepID=A0A8H6KA29_9PEZI|nr:hypothetical protein CPLU01_09126 [Colletotrichum plurivorum]